MTALAEACERVLAAIARRHKLRFEYEQMSWLKPAHCDPELMQLIEAKTRALDYSYKIMPSGAGHDVQIFCGHTKAAMFFVPSVGGVSHAPDEWTHWSDIERGTQLLLECVMELVCEKVEA